MKRQEALKHSARIHPMTLIPCRSSSGSAGCSPEVVPLALCDGSSASGHWDTVQKTSQVQTRMMGRTRPPLWFAQRAAVLKSKVSEGKSGFSDALSGVQSKFHKKPAADTSLAEPLDPSGFICGFSVSWTVAASPLSVMNVVISLRSERFCAEDRGFLSEAGQFLSGNP